MAMQQHLDSPRTAMNTSNSCTALSSCTQSQQSISVKIGGLWKRSRGMSRFTKANYKHRVFILTDQALSYYGGTVDRVGQMKGRVPLDSVRAVEFVDISAFNLAHTLQVVYVSKKSGFMSLYVIATTKEECSDWVATLRQACYFNRDMLMHYHPGAFVKSKWTCCQHHTRTTLGCQPTYHLLTRSSSRYAQMRRKDTLTNSSNSQRQGQVGSRDRHSSGRRSAATNQAISTDLEGAPGSDAIVNPKPNQRSLGLSNSFMELSIHPPNTEEVFALGSPPPTATSKRSSRNSNELSIGVGSMVLTRVSLHSSEVEDGEKSRPQSGSFSLTPKCIRSERGRMASRSQIGPAWPTSTPVSSNLSQYRKSYEHEFNKTLPRSFKSRSRDSANWKLGEGRGSLGEEDPLPFPPLIPKKGESGGQPHYSPTVSSPIASHTSQASPADFSPSSNSKIKHGGLEGTATKPRATGKLHTRTYGFSQSMGALTKPLIEPKVSNSNPNVIHV